ncbi:MAG: hypothetical protein ACFFDP_02305 [Promethearchaeota archaeon]
MEKTTTLIVFDKEIPLNDFVEKLVKNVILSIVTSLRAPELTGKEKIHIRISKE